MNKMNTNSYKKMCCTVRFCFDNYFYLFKMSPTPIDLFDESVITNGNRLSSENTLKTFFFEYNIQKV